MLAAGVGASLYFKSSRTPQIADSADAGHKETKEEPAPAKTPNPPVVPKGADHPPAKPTPPAVVVPRLLTETPKPAELSGDEVYRRALRSAAFIGTTDGVRFGIGSGVLIDSDRRLVITNAHVTGDHKKVGVMFPVYDGATQVIADVKYYDTRAKELIIAADVVARNVDKDLALLRLAQLPEDVRAVRIASQPAATGATVYSIGNSGFVDEKSLWRLTTGTVRGRAKNNHADEDDRRDYMALETQAPTNKGDSGGPVVNGQAELVAIVASGHRMQRLVSFNVDVTEVRAFVGEYYRTVVANWKEPEPEAAPPSAAAVYDNLLAVLKAGTPVERIVAARRLGELRAKARSAIPLLLAALESSDQELQVAAGVALNQIGNPEVGAERVLLSFLKSNSPAARAYVAKLFATDFVVPQDALGDVIKALHDSSPEVLISASQAIGKAGAKARLDALGDLLDLLANPNPAVRDAAASAVAALGTPGVEDRATLLARLKHANLRVRLNSLALLRLLGADKDDIRDIWVPLLKDPEPELRLAAATTLGGSAELVNRPDVDFISLAADPDVAVRTAAARAARHLTNTFTATEKVTKLLDAETDKAVKAVLAESLLALLVADSRNLALLRRLLKEGPPAVRIGSAKKIAAVGPEASDAVADLLVRIREDQEEVRVAALGALASIGPQAVEAIPVAAELFDRGDTPTPVLVAAVDVLAGCGGDGMRQLEVLAKKSLEGAVRERICGAFSKTISLSEESRAWLLDQAELLPRSREAITTTLAKTATNATLLELLRRTHLFKPAKVGEKAEMYEADYRKWVLVTVGKLKVADIATRDTKTKIFERLEYLAKNDKSPEVSTEAAATLARLRR